MNVFTIIYKGNMHHVSVRQFRTYLCIVLIVLLSLIISVSFLSTYWGRQKVIVEIKQAIKGNEYKEVEGFKLFKDKKNQAYITTNNYREVADISISGTGDAGVRKTWEGE